MREPARLELAEVQIAFRELHDLLRWLDVGTGNPDLHGRRFLNAGPSVNKGDFVTRRELDDIVSALNALAKRVAKLE